MYSETWIFYMFIIKTKILLEFSVICFHVYPHILFLKDVLFIFLLYSTWSRLY